MSERPLGSASSLVFFSFLFSLFHSFCTISPAPSLSSFSLSRCASLCPSCPLSLQLPPSHPSLCPSFPPSLSLPPSLSHPSLPVAISTTQAWARQAASALLPSTCNSSSAAVRPPAFPSGSLSCQNHSQHQTQRQRQRQR